MRAASILFVLALALLPGAVFAAPSEFGGGSASAGTGTTLDLSEADLTTAYKDALKNAGADDATISALEKAGAIDRAVKQIKRQKNAPRADTFAFYSETKDGIKKWAVTILPGGLPDDDQKTVTTTHEAGHRQIDRAAVDAVNKAAKDGKLPPNLTRQQTVDLLQSYENAGNKQFHVTFGGSPKQTKAKMDETKMDPKGLQEKAVEDAKKAGQEALDKAIAALGHASLPERPTLKSLLPTQALDGATVIVSGTGFGTSRNDVTVFFGCVGCRPLVVNDTSLAVNVPADAAEACDVEVQVHGQFSNPVAFTMGEEASTTAAPRIRVKLQVGKNPLKIGEETSGVFTVENTRERVRIHFINKSPAVVEFVGGNEQTVTSSGGETNTATFTIRGITGPRMYNVDYDWQRLPNI